MDGRPVQRCPNMVANIIQRFHHSTFKSTEHARNTVEDTIRTILGDTDHITIDKVHLKRKLSERDPDTIWSLTSIDLAAEGGFGSETLRRKSIATFKKIENPFRPVAEKLGS